MKIKRVIVGMAIVVVMSSSSAVSLTAWAGSCDSMATVVSATPQSTVLQWKYKVENGKLYKCLYNTVTQECVGKWQYVCDYPYPS